MNYNELIKREFDEIGSELSSFYVEPTSSIEKITINYDFKSKNILNFNCVEELKHDLENKKNYFELGEKIDYYNANKNNVIFIGEGGIGKTIQLFILYNKKKNDRTLLIRAKSIKDFAKTTEFPSFIKCKENTLYIDALNEGVKGEIKSLFSECNCRIVSTSRPINKNIKGFKVINLEMSVNGIDIATKMSVNKYLPGFVINILGGFNPRMSIKMLQYISKVTKYKKSGKTTPVGYLRDMIEQYFKSILKKYKLDANYWNYIKDTKKLFSLLLEPKTIEFIEEKLETYNIDKKLVDLFIRENIIQQKDDNWILSNIEFFHILKSHELMKEKESKDLLSKEEILSIQESLNLLFLWNNQAIVQTILSEIIVRNLRKKMEIDIIIKKLLSLAPPLNLFHTKNKPTFEYRDLKSKSWFAYSIENIWTIETLLISLSISFSSEDISYKIPIELLHDFKIENTDPIFISNFLPKKFKSNEFHLNNKTFIKSDEQLLIRIVDFGKIPSHDWFWIWVENNLFLFYNTFVNIGYEKEKLLKLIMKKMINKSHGNWFNLAILYKENNLSFDLKEFSRKYRISRKSASAKGFKNIKPNLSKKQFFKYLNNKKYCNISKYKSEFEPLQPNFYAITTHFYYNDYLYKYTEHSRYWEQTLSSIFRRLTYNQILKMIDKYYYEFNILYSELIYHEDIWISLKSYEINLKFINNKIIPFNKKINKKIIEFSHGKIHYKGILFEFIATDNIKNTYFNFSKEISKNYLKSDIKFYYKNGYMIKGKSNKYIKIQIKKYNGVLISRHLIDCEKMHLYDLDENYNITTKEKWINKRDIESSFLLKKIKN